MHLSISLCISQMFIGHTHYYISFSVFEGTTITTLSLIYLYNIYYIYKYYMYIHIYISRYISNSLVYINTNIFVCMRVSH